VSVDVDAFYADLTMSVSVIRGDARQYYVSELTGQHQAPNLGAALAAITVLERTFAIDQEDIRRGLRSIRRNSGIMARTQVVATEPTTIVDVSHNAAGLHALVRTLVDTRVAGPLHVVFGAMADKDVKSMLAELLALNATLHLCAPQLPRSMPVPDLVDLAKQVGHERVIEYASVAEAVQGARALGTSIICGSFHVADEAADVLGFAV
ncbi:MAG: glutamate ligase domain-containing protein, partial [Bacteroidota bacterium]